MMQDHGGKFNPPSIDIAKVVYVEETNNKLIDLKIEVNGMPVAKKNIYISDFLLKEHMREIRTDGMTDVGKKNVMNGTVSLENDGGHNASSHMHSMKTFTVNHTKAYTRDTLKVDDLVAVMAVQDRQTYIILSRVVKI